MFLENVIKQQTKIWNIYYQKFVKYDSSFFKCLELQVEPNFFVIYDQIFKGLITNFRNDFDTLHLENYNQIFPKNLAWKRRISCVHQRSFTIQSKNLCEIKLTKKFWTKTELIFTAKMITGKEAAGIRLVNHSVPQNENGDAAFEKALEVADQILPNGPVGVKMGKIAINKGVDVSF